MKEYILSNIKFIMVYLIIINLIAYICMGVDKKRAIKHKYRISERCLMTLALMFGSVGVYLGMKCFRHKTKHWYFKYGVPFITIVQIIVSIYFFK